MLQKIQKQNQNQKSIECTLKNEIEKNEQQQKKKRHQMAKKKNLMNVDYNLLSFLSKYVHAPMSIDG